MNDDERWQGIAIYGLYLVSLFTGVPFFIGVILAYLFKGNASPAVRTHFEHQIGLFWRVVFSAVVSFILFSLGGVLTATLVLAIIGVPMIILGGLVALWTFIMVLTRSLRGIGRLNQQEPYPLPGGWGL